MHGTPVFRVLVVVRTLKEIWLARSPPRLLARRVPAFINFKFLMLVGASASEFIKHLTGSSAVVFQSAHRLWASLNA